MRPAELQTLRAEARQALEDLQRLPGFADLWDKLPPVPTLATDWRWWAVRNVCRNRDPGVVVWEERPVSALSPQKTAWLLEEHREAVHRNGTELVARIPSHVPVPPPDQVHELDLYRDSVEEFAAAYVFGAQWSGRAVHDALRRRTEIKLPSSRGEGFGTPIDGPVTLDPTQPLPRGALRELGRRLLEAAPEPVSSLASKGRETTWQGALRATGNRIKSVGLTSTERGHLHQARRYLNASVNGELDGTPLDPTDAPDWFDRPRQQTPRGPDV